MSMNSARKLPLEPVVKPSLRPYPFLKWAGGKSQLLPELLKRLPAHFENYFEPFVGGGALLFYLQPASAYISDINPELVNVYKIVRSQVEPLMEDLSSHIYDEGYYYKLRELDRSSTYKKLSPIKRASRLIYLNKTCYNGLYRVNASGQFNTPFGRYTNPRIVDEENLRACSRVLKGVSIKLADFEKIEKLVVKNDFVYFDPPYAPLSTTANFTGYSKGGFDFEMQRRLGELCRRLDKKGVRFLLSNSSAKAVAALYKGFELEFVSAKRAINSVAAKRGEIKELLVRNY